MSVLLIDSAGDLWSDEFKQLGVKCIDMPYSYSGNEYRYDLSKDNDLTNFYKAVRGGEVPKTMALNPQDYMQILQPIFEAGEDALYVSFSHKMSGTFDHLNTAIAALAESYPERKCTVFDTKSVCMGAGIQMDYAAELKSNGATDEEIVAALGDFTNKVAMYFVVDDLMHLKRGGRLVGFAAFAGTLLNLKPILTTDEHGGLTVIAKKTGKKAAMHVLADKVATELTGTEFAVYVVDADCPEDGDALAEQIATLRPDAKVKRLAIGPIVASHCGPGTIGVIFVADKRPIEIK